MLICIIKRTSHIFKKINFSVYTAVFDYYLFCHLLDIFDSFMFSHSGKFFFKSHYRHRLKSLEFYIFFTQHRCRFSRFKNIHTYKTEVSYSLESLTCKLCIYIVQKNTSAIVHRSRQSHSFL